MTSEGSVFGQDAVKYQLIGVAIAIIPILFLFVWPAEPGVLRTSLWVLLGIALFLYVVGGHALVYGPHLFVLALAEFVARPFRKEEPPPSIEDAEAIRTPEERCAYEAPFREMVGCTLSGVRYFQIEGDEGEPSHRDAPHIGHIVDFGLDLTTSDGRVFGITWVTDFSGFGVYGLGIRRHSLASELDGPHPWDLSTDDRWCPFIGTAIREVRLHWASWSEGDGHRMYCPHDLEVVFSSGKRVFISASQYFRKDDSLMGMSDSIAVIFDESVAESRKIGPFAQDE